MPFLADVRRAAGAGLLLAACCAGAQQRVPASGAPAPDAPAPDVRAVDAAVARVRADPDLPHQTASTELRFKPGDKAEASAERKPARKDPKQDAAPAEIGDQVAAAARLLVWLLGAAAVAWLALRLRRWAGVRSGAVRRPAAAMPTHVQGEDIRPQALPPSVGVAAATLWQDGEPRAALSLLYRGAVSRLAHAHGVPIAASSTEGDCLALAAPVLVPAQQDYLVRLVDGWRRQAYGASPPTTAQVLALCEAFDAQLGAAAGLEPAP